MSKEDWYKDTLDESAPSIYEKNIIRSKIGSDIEEYIKEGGKVEVCRPHKSMTLAEVKKEWSCSNSEFARRKGYQPYPRAKA